MSPLAFTPSLNIADFGAAGDGVQDDRPAIVAALAQLGSAGGTLRFPSGVYRIALDPEHFCLGIESRIMLQGVPHRSVLRFDSPDPALYCEGLHLAGSGIRIEGMTLARNSLFGGILLKLCPSYSVRLYRVTFDGTGEADSPLVHGIEIAAQPGGLTDGLRIEECRFANLHYGLFGTNDSTAVLRNVRVLDSEFAFNTSDDLGFNSPLVGWSGIDVLDCRFHDNRSPGPNAMGGAAISLANIHDVSIRGCRVWNYDMEAFHIEGRTSQVRICGNSFVNCGSQGYGTINLISGAEIVTITGNQFDSRLSPAWPCVSVSQGGVNYPTADNVVIIGNTFQIVPGGRIILDDGTKNVVFGDNIVVDGGE